MTLLGALFWSGLAAAAAGGPDLAVSIVAKPKAPRHHQTVEISVTVTNQGHAPANGTVISLRTRGGLRSLRLVSASPDTVQSSCAVGGAPGGPPQCTITPVPPSCQSTGSSLSCRYSYYQLQPAGQPNDSLTIIASAVTGARRIETVSARATSDSPNANTSNNSARFTFNLQTKKRHGR